MHQLIIIPTRGIAKDKRNKAKGKSDWICKKGSYTRNYKYLEIPF